MKRLLSSIAFALFATLALAGCGSNSSTSSSSSSGFNEADVTFAQSMIPHHQQAVQMANMAKTHASAPEVKALAVKIAAAQSPEINTMSGWLKDWKEVPSGSMSQMGHMGGMDSGAMPSMMSDADLKKLDAASAAEFDPDVAQYD